MRNAVDRSDLSAEDAALAARLIQVANSPLYRGRTAITSLQMAVTCMGYNAVRTLLMSLAMQQINPLLRCWSATFTPSGKPASRSLPSVGPWRSSVRI